MKKIFKSKVELWILIPLSLILAGAEIFMIMNQNLLGEIALGLLAVFVVYICINTFYTVTGDNTLKIKSGFFFNREIYIKSIKKVRPVKDHRAWPALSTDRLEISYNRYGKVIVSPNKKSEFIKELKEINPRIRVEERS